MSEIKWWCIITDIFCVQLYKALSTIEKKETITGYLKWNCKTIWGSTLCCLFKSMAQVSRTNQAAFQLFDNDAFWTDQVIMTWPDFCYHKCRFLYLDELADETLSALTGQSVFQWAPFIVWVIHYPVNMAKQTQFVQEKMYYRNPKGNAEFVYDSI